MKWNSKFFWNVVMAIGGILFLSYFVQLINKKEFIAEVSPCIVQDRGGETFHITGILNAVYSGNTSRQALWLFNPLNFWRGSLIALCSFGGIAILFMLNGSLKKTLRLKQKEIEQNAAEAKGRLENSGQIIDRLKNDLENYQARNKNLEDRIAPITEAAKQMQTKLKEMEAEYLQKTQAKDNAHAEELSLYKEATMTKLVEIEKLKKEKKELIEKKPPPDEIEI